VVGCLINTHCAGQGDTAFGGGGVRGLIDFQTRLS
jgi:hypothetical protein